VHGLTAVNVERHLTDYEADCSQCVEQASYHERQHVSLVRSQQVKAAPRRGQFRAVHTRCSISVERLVEELDHPLNHLYRRWDISFAR